MPIKIADSLPARAVIGKRKHFRYDRTPCRDTGHSSSSHRFTQPDASENHYRDPDPALFIQHADPDRGRSDPDRNIPFQKYAGGSSSHLYKTFDDIRDQKYDGFIITGAPVETMPFEEVEYWKELTEIMDWTKTHVHSTLHICWGAQAGLYYHYGIPKYMLPEKMSGIFKHHVLLPKEPLLRGFDDIFCAPHSRHTEVRAADIRKDERLTILAESHEAGVHIVEAMNGRQIFVLGHGEYDADTLKKEYERDLAKGMNPEVPRHYFRNDDPNEDVLVTWKAHANLFYTNWVNYYVYQTTPYYLDKM